ncbi:MAG: hypothetical protein HWE27_16760 [Gammaproteobacteria bacterium]|nr:hypothetical protein [Gammaproteobacteria bacterium]
MALHYYFDDFPSIIAHRGLSAFAPENTQASFILAAQHGFTWVETDIRLTKDQKAMVFHDATLERTTNYSGYFSELSLKDALTIDAGSWFSPRFSNQTIPSLEQLLDLAVKFKLGVNLEIKPNYQEDELTAEIIHQTLRARKKNPPVLLSSYSVSALEVCQKLRPRTPRALVVDSFELNTPQEIISLTERLGCTSLHINKQLVFTELIQLSHVAPFDLMCFTVNTKETAEQCWSAGCVSVFSDNGLQEPVTGLNGA